jgi:NitT/TauT family transport system substrate-binding protein
MGLARHASMLRRAGLALCAGAFALGGIATAAVAADTVKIGVTKLASNAQIAIARDRGYFTAEGLNPDLVFFDAQQPIAVALASGDLDFGNAAETAALYSLAGQGTLRIIGGGVSEAPTFHYLSLLVSNHAFDAGLKSAKDLPGHSFGLTQVGTGLQYSLGLIAEKYRFDLKSVQILPLQSNANIASAIAGGRADAAIFSSTGALPLIKRGDAKLLFWVADETGQVQANLLLTSPKMANEHHDTVERFLRAIRNGSRDYHDAFTGADGKRADGPTAPAVLDIIAKYLGQPVELVKEGLPYLDRDARLRAKDVQHQIAWYRSQGLMKGEANADALIDARYAVLLP